jgi:hypothetical protein
LLIGVLCTGILEPTNISVPSKLSDCFYFQGVLHTAPIVPSTLAAMGTFIALVALEEISGGQHLRRDKVMTEETLVPQGRAKAQTTKVEATLCNPPN